MMTGLQNHRTVTTIRWWRWCRWRHSDADDCNGDTKNNKSPLVMKTDLRCSTLHQVCPHCAPIRASPHYSSLSQWVWRRKKRWKVSSFFAPRPRRKQKSISSIGSCPMVDCLAFFWCSSHTHTHLKPLWHLFSSLLLALHCPCHMASEEGPLCVFERRCVCVCVSRLWGQRGVIGNWPRDKDSPLHQRSLWIHEDKPGWMGEQKPWRSRLRRGRGCWSVLLLLCGWRGH